MHVDVIEDLRSLSAVEDNWNVVYDADPDAQVFLSWKWLSAWLTLQYGTWVILAVKAVDKPDAPYVAFLPLRILTKTTEAGRIRNELNMVGNFAADYTGLICLPQVEHQAIPAFARHLKRMNWARLSLENLRITDARMRLLLTHFPKSNFLTEEISRVGQFDDIDNNICPYVSLPADWDAYLGTLSANTRQKLRRLLKLVDYGDDYRITQVTSESFERDLETLLRFWEAKWKPRKGDLVHALVRSNRSMLTLSFKAGLLFLPTLWQKDRPLASFATFVDPRKRAFLFYMSGRDEAFDGPPPGLTLHAYSIRHAIENGFVEYDFLRGNEPYKYSFGVAERRIRCTVVRTKTGINLSGRIETRTIPEVLERATALHQAGKIADAERGYRQVLEIDAENVDAVHRLGQLLAGRGDHGAAIRLFKTLAGLRPDLFKPWLCLAQCCEALGRDFDAADAYREAIRIRPDLPDAFTGMTRLLIRLGCLEEVNAALMKALAGTMISGPAADRMPARKRPDIN